MNRYEDLEVWQLAYELALLVYRDTRSLPEGERFGLTAQMRSSAVSIVSNIAEGAGRPTRGEFRLLVGYGSGSSSELSAQYRLTAGLEYLDPRIVSERLEAIGRVRRMLYGLLLSLGRSRP